MSDEFTIQCPKCGTLYNDLQDVCPYCGEPQPTEETAFVPDDYFVEPESPHAFADVPADDAYDDASAADPFSDDDIFAVDGGPYGQPADYPTDPAADYFGAIGRPDVFAPADDFTTDDSFVGPDTPYLADDSGEDETLLPEEEPAQAAPRRFKFRRVALGCLGLLLCAGLFYGAIGIFAVRAGLQERTSQAQSESQTHYERGQQLLAENSIELAVAEFERAVKLNPNFREARQALRETQRLAQLQPTPTSETRTAAAAEIFAQAQELFNAESWADAAQMLSQVRDLDSTYETERVSEMLFEANFQLGLQQVSPEQVREALAAFEQALAERPDDEKVRTERNKAALYLNGLAALDEDKLSAVKAFTQLFRLDENYLDTRQQLRQAYEAYGDQLTNDGEWCLAKDQYTEANALRASTSVLGKLNISAERCQTEAVTQAPGGAAPRPGVTPAGPGSSSATAGPAGITTSATVTATTEATADSAPVSSAGGRILFSAYNVSETRWEILAAPASGGQPQTLATNAIMPALSPNGDILLYRSERSDSIGIHALNLTTGEDVRATVVRQHILPRWAGDNLQFVFPAQEPGTNRWQVFVGFADGKSDPIILLDGRTPDSDGKIIVYQGTDPEGNQPGIYSRPFGGGEATRLTSHESDRMPVLSPDGSRLAYMSTQNGNWDIFVVSAAGGSPRAVVSSPGNDGLPAWSPDGSQLAFVSDRDGSWAIYVVNLAGGAPSKLTDWDGNRPDWLTAQIWWGR